MDLSWFPPMVFVAIAIVLLYTSGYWTKESGIWNGVAIFALGITFLFLSFFTAMPTQWGFPSVTNEIKTGVVYSMPFYLNTVKNIETEKRGPPAVSYIFVLEDNGAYRLFETNKATFDISIEEFPKDFIFFKNEKQPGTFNVVGVR